MEDDDGDEDNDRTGGDDEQLDPDDGGTRGTVLVTLRNVPPYTEWCAFSYA